MPANLISQIQRYTNFPWWNGRAYAEYHGFPQRIRKMNIAAGEAIDDVADVIEMLRAQKQYAEADRLRTIAGRLARALGNDEEHLIRCIAKGWK